VAYVLRLRGIDCAACAAIVQHLGYIVDTHHRDKENLRNP
jgi:fructose-1,6-bisphosphatase/inositol monophosphatase family enzyme